MTLSESADSHISPIIGLSTLGATYAGERIGLKNSGPLFVDLFTFFPTPNEGEENQPNVWEGKPHLLPETIHCPVATNHSS
jgi:hypothetical protein